MMVDELTPRGRKLAGIGMIRLLIVTCLLAAGTGEIAAQEQTDAQRREARFLERRRAEPPFQAGAIVNRELLPPFPQVGEATAAEPNGILYGSFGGSIRWVTAFMDEFVEIRPVGSKDSFYVIRDAERGQYGMRRRIDIRKPGAGETVVDMKYGAFAVRLKPGDYEIAAVAAHTSSHAFFKEFKPAPRFSVRPGAQVYLGRLTLVPVVRHSTGAEGRSPQMLIEFPPMPSTESVGFRVWVENGQANDRRLLDLAEATDAIDLTELLRTTLGPLGLDALTDELMDHQLALKRWLEKQR